MRDASRPSLPLILGLALMLVGGSIIAWTGIEGFEPNPLRAGWDAMPGSSDDAMRIVQVRDLAQGQGWFDLRQTRLGVGEAVPMHWSRLADAPLLALYRQAETVVEPAQAERVAAWVWPRILALAWLMLSLAIAGQLAGRHGVWIAAFLLMPAAVLEPEFFPGRVDHHNLQLVLVLAVASAAIAARRRPWLGLVAGGAAALSLSVGLETLPVVAAAGVAVAVAWALEDTAEARRAAQVLPAGLALGLPLAMVATLPPRALAVPLCDQLSPAVLGPILLACAGVWALASWPDPIGRAGRLVALAAVALAAAGAAVAIAPDCLRGPYAGLDAEVRAGMATIEERAGLVAALERAAVPDLHRLLVWPLVGLVGLMVGAATGQRPRRFGCALLLAMTLAALAVGFVEVRGMRLALPLAFFGGVALVARAFRLRGLRLAAVPVLAVAAALAVTPLGQLVPARAVPGVEDAETPPPLLARVRACVTGREVAPLAALPPGRVLAMAEFGAFLLLKTPHEVVAAPYHRNVEGLRAGYRFAGGEAGEVRQLASELGIDYVVVCRGYQGHGAVPPGSLRDALRRGRAPDWLRPMPSGERLLVYAVGATDQVSSGL